MKQKDALTDLVEHAQETTPIEGQRTPKGDVQVTNADGDLITLGQKKPQNIPKENKGIPLELMELVSATKRAVEKAFDRAIERMRKHE